MTTRITDGQVMRATVPRSPSDIGRSQPVGGGPVEIVGTARRPGHSEGRPSGPVPPESPSRSGRAHFVTRLRAGPSGDVDVTAELWVNGCIGESC